MKPGASAAILRDSQALFVSGSVAGLDDEQLLARFSAGLGAVSELAFAAIVTRHGPMVLATCRRALGDPHQAEDAFQATFLVLARRARSVRGRSLGPWLYGVARKVCLRARGDRDRRAHREAGLPLRVVSGIDPTDLAHQSELRDLIDRELARIPGKLREAIVLCDLQGLSHDEAARHLGCPTGTIKSRQARGREKLRERLAKLGLDPAAVASPAAIVPARLASLTASAALPFQQGGLIAAGVGPASVALSLSTLRELSMIHLFKLATAASAGLGTLAVAVAVQDPAPPTLPSAPSPALAPQPIPSPTPLPTASAKEAPRADPLQQPPQPTQPKLELPSPPVLTPQPATAVQPPVVQSPVSAPVGPFLVNERGNPVSQGRLPQVDRLQSLEAKLDRVLDALERTTRKPEGLLTPAPEPAPTPRSRNTPAQPVMPTNPPREAALPANGPRPAPISIETRLSALENRVNQLEANTRQQLERLEAVTRQLSIRVMGDAPALSAPRTDAPAQPTRRSPSNSPRVSERRLTVESPFDLGDNLPPPDDEPEAPFDGPQGNPFELPEPVENVIPGPSPAPTPTANGRAPARRTPR